MDTAFELLPPGGAIPLATQHSRLDAACHHLDSPVAVVDLHALSANVHALLHQAHGKPIRVASQAIRSVPVLNAVLATAGYRGVLAYTLAEAIMLVRHQVCDDIIVGHPTVTLQALAELLRAPQLLAAITLIIDHPDQLRIIRSAGIPEAPIRVCLDMDISLKAGPVHIDARRSPIQREDQLLAAADHITASKEFRLVGLMGYGAHLAAVTDDTAVLRTMQRLSEFELRARRQQLVEVIQQRLEQRGLPGLEFVNGGGIGSVETTTPDEALTEVVDGSGLYGPQGVDRYHDVVPQSAVVFGLDVVRSPQPGMITVAAGGWIAPGAPAPARLPQPVYPPGLAYTTNEGADETQTSLTTSNYVPTIGDRIWFRPTKVEELAEHVKQFFILHRDRLIAQAVTYRGAGYALL